MAPMPHPGPVLPLAIRRPLTDGLTAKRVDFIIAPSVRFHGQPDAQWEMVFRDSTGYAIKMKGFASKDAVWTTWVTATDTPRRQGFGHDGPESRGDSLNK
ncbi:MAG: hypothetical protein CML66_25295 [Rhodobacteraceae bacterium]|nr:hypothetical protein [Paracoccaceae bacterium]MAY47102.1 hypothetical protein [Paracoccaceae bacterium]